MKAIKIDVEKREVYFVEIGTHFEEINKMIGCDTFTCPIAYENNDTMYCDDEALLNPEDIKGGFIYPDWNYPIVSNALILGCDNEGESIDVKSSIEEITKGIRFIDKDEPYLKRYINQFN